jgi:uncharacterized protein YbaR (Trm112 family)/ubiquinone/menaquinone biosynthesis C-methylase UbiE
MGERNQREGSGMKLLLLEIMACPKCQANLECNTEEADKNGDVISGELTCLECKKSYPVIRGIPRFVPNEEYAGSFGFQWNKFRCEQLDSDNGTGLSRQRVLSEAELTPEGLKGLQILEAGCGAGRFLEVISEYECDVVGVDISNAVEAAAETVKGRPNAHVVQASIYELPFKPEVFNLCYSIGVLQHTPDAQQAAIALPRVVGSGGRIAITVYERKPWTLLNGKYLIRPLTKRLEPKILLVFVKIIVTLLFPITELLFRVPFIGKVFAFFIPICNYTNTQGLSFIQRYRSVVLDTFDMLSPAHDKPLTQAELEKALVAGNVKNIRRISSSGLNLVGEKI